MNRCEWCARKLRWWQMVPVFGGWCRRCDYSDGGPPCRRGANVDARKDTLFSFGDYR